MFSGQKPLFVAFFVSEKFELFGLGWHRFGGLSPVVNYLTVLFVGYLQNTYLPFGRQHFLYAFYVYFGTLARGTVPGVNAVLHHGKTVFYQFFPETGRVFAFAFGIGGKIEKYKKPHDPVGIELVMMYHDNTG